MSTTAQVPPGDPAAPDELDKLPIEGFKGTPEEIERQWYEQVYKGRGDSMAQLTWRAVIMGSVLGGVLSLTNLYIGLKAGWGFGVAITACILSYAIWTFLYKVRVARTPMTILENNCMQSTASSAGYSTGGTLVSAFAAFILLNGTSMPVPLMMGWVLCLAILGVTMAIPMKRQMINTEQLRFPSGIAAAETLRALHSKGSKGIQSARGLGCATGRIRYSAASGACASTTVAQPLNSRPLKPNTCKSLFIASARCDPATGQAAWTLEGKRKTGMDPAVGIEEWQFDLAIGLFYPAKSRCFWTLFKLCPSWLLASTTAPRPSAFANGWHSRPTG